MSKNKDAKRKAKIKAPKAQAVQQAQARNDHVAEAIRMDRIVGIEEQLFEGEF